MDVIVDRCAALDVHKKTVMACVRTPDGVGGRRQELREFRTFSRDLARLRFVARERSVTHVAMEATGVYWKPVWYVFEGASFKLLLANARHSRTCRPQDRRRRRGVAVSVVAVRAAARQFRAATEIAPRAT